jgi:hypothetical protein
MAAPIIWPIIGIAVLVLLILALVVYRTSGGKRPTDYRTLFIIGASYIPIGIATENSAFSIIGLVLIGIGISNRDKWEDNKTPVSENQRKIVIVLLALTFLAVFGTFLFWYTK